MEAPLVRARSDLIEMGFVFEGLPEGAFDRRVIRRAVAFLKGVLDNPGKLVTELVVVSHPTNRPRLRSRPVWLVFVESGPSDSEPEFEYVAALIDATTGSPLHAYYKRPGA